MIFVFINLALVEVHLPGPLWLAVGGIFWLALVGVSVAGSNVVCGTMCWIGAIQDIFEPFARPRLRLDARLGRSVTLALLILWMPVGWLVLPSLAAHDRMPLDAGLGWERHAFQFALAAASPGERRARAITLSAVEFGRMSVGPGDTLALETTQKRWRIVSGAAAADPVEGRAEDIDISANGVAAVIAHRAGDSGIYVADPKGVTRRLPNLAATSIFGARWSPDGSRLLFLADTARGSGIFEIGLDGAPPTLKVPISLNLVDPPAWSADGRSVTYPLFDGSRWRLWRASLNGPPNARPVSDFGWCGVRRMGADLYAVRTDVAGIWKLDPTPMLIAAGYPKNQCYIWAVGAGRFAYPDRSGAAPRTVVTGSIAGGALSATPTHGVPLDIEGSSIALDPKTGKLVVLELADQRDIAIVSLRRR